MAGEGGGEERRGEERRREERRDERRVRGRKSGGGGYGRVLSADKKRVRGSVRVVLCE